MDDDYVAQILAKEARESSQKFASEGLGAFLPRKPAGNAPKPNTRFLRHLIKETDNHNLALKRKEERETRERLRQLRDQSAVGSTSTSQASRRNDRDGSTRDSERHRREDRGERHGSHRRRHRSRSSSTEKDRSRRHRRRDDDYDRSKDTHRDRGREERRRDHHRHESSRTEHRRRERSYSRSRSRSPRKDRDSGRHRSERRSHRSESQSGSRSSRSHKDRTDRQSHRHENPPSRERHSSPQPTAGQRDHEQHLSAAKERREVLDDSDPLEDLVGPLPPRKNGENSAPIRSRGRGAYKPSSSAIDAHFAPDYDPTLDVQPDDDEQSPSKQFARRPVAGLMTQEDDWDMAMEAFRDRAKWKQKGEERLRAAGMNEETISRWKSNAAFTGMDGEREPEDVRWSKKGEGREWDRGKVVDEDGHIDVKAAWG